MSFIIKTMRSHLYFMSASTINSFFKYFLIFFSFFIDNFSVDTQGLSSLFSN